MRMRELRVRKGLKQNEFAKLVGVSSMCMCLIENYKCLPIPQDLEEICKVLECSADNLYEPHEINLQIGNIKAVEQRKSRNNDIYRLTADLPERARKFFKENLKQCGYKDITQWVNHCYERLESQFQEQKKKDFTEPTKQYSEVLKVKENVCITNTNKQKIKVNVIDINSINNISQKN